jgi:uncharacterized protein
MKRANLLLICVLQIVFSYVSSAQSKIKPEIEDRLFPAEAVIIKGFIGDKLDQSYKNRILAQNVSKLVEPFINRTEERCWQSEFWGKWFTSAVLAYRYRPEPELKKVLDQAVSGLLSTQTPDGYIGNYRNDKHLEQWDIWGRKYCMLGLLAYYDLTNENRYLTAATKLADHLIRELGEKNVPIVKKGNHRGMAASSVLEPVCLLYSHTGDERYLKFAKEIVTEWETPYGPQLISKSNTNVAKRFPKPTNWYGPEQGQKAYEMMSCYEGLLELYRLTGKAEYLRAVENTWQNILDTEINIAGSGSAMECWFGGKQLQTMHINSYQETCVTATWIKLSQQLLRLTGEAKYGDAIEQTYYNALLGAMYQDGADWAKYSPLAGQRGEGSEQCGMGLNCCVASGPRGLFTLPLTAVMSEKKGVSVNFFVNGTYRVQIPEGQHIEVEQKTDYPESGNITLKINTPQDLNLKVRIRIPVWSQRSSLKVNDQPVADLIPGKYAEISRVWRQGDIVKLTLDMRGRVLRIGGVLENLAIVRGPVVLTRDARLGTPHVDETIKPIVDKDGFVDLKPAGINQEGIWMKYKSLFKIESYKEGNNNPVDITLCDYASAGNTLDVNSWFRVWLPQSIDPTK